MGFDLHGNNCPELELPFEELKKMSVEDVRQYCETLRKNQQYFRSSIGWWKFIHWAVMNVGEIRDTKICRSGWMFNNGYKVSKTRSKRIAKKIRERILNEKHFPLWIKNMEEEFREMGLLEHEPFKKVDESLIKDIREHLEDFVTFCDKSEGFGIY